MIQTAKVSVEAASSLKKKITCVCTARYCLKFKSEWGKTYPVKAASISSTVLHLWLNLEKFLGIWSISTTYQTHIVEMCCNSSWSIDIKNSHCHRVHFHIHVTRTINSQTEWVLLTMLHNIVMTVWTNGFVYNGTSLCPSTRILLNVLWYQIVADDEIGQKAWSAAIYCRWSSSAKTTTRCQKWNPDEELLKILKTQPKPTMANISKQFQHC